MEDGACSILHPPSSISAKVAKTPRKAKMEDGGWRIEHAPSSILYPLFPWRLGTRRCRRCGCKFPARATRRYHIEHEPALRFHPAHARADSWLLDRAAELSGCRGEQAESADHVGL